MTKNSRPVLPASVRTRPAGTVTVLSPSARKKEMVAAFEEAQVISRAVATTRGWVNAPPGDLTP